MPSQLAYPSAPIAQMATAFWAVFYKPNDCLAHPQRGLEMSSFALSPCASRASQIVHGQDLLLTRAGDLSNPELSLAGVAL